MKVIGRTPHLIWQAVHGHWTVVLNAGRWPWRDLILNDRAFNSRGIRIPLFGYYLGIYRYKRNLEQSYERR